MQTPVKNIISLGIDIGTTTISCSVVDVSNKKQLASFTVKNDTNIVAQNNFSKIQDANKIIEKTRNLLDKTLDDYPDISSIGITGQMHGIVYIDENNKALSPLFTWQDQSGNEKIKNATYSEKIKKLTGYSVPVGYGIVTYYYHALNNLIPNGTKTFLTIYDYLALTLTNCSPIIHSSSACSLGLFDLENNRFYDDAFKLLGDFGISLPKVSNESIILGKYRDISVTIPLGDNQASFFGSVQNDGDVLANYGTGSQISIVTDRPINIDGIEIRPYIDNKYLACASALCGGKAFAMLEKFFREYILLATGKDTPQYDLLCNLAEQAYDKQNSLPDVKTTFCGTRQNPEEKGAFLSITEQNFTPQNFALGLLFGMAKELYEQYAKIPRSNAQALILSGNTVRKTRILRSVLEKTFNLKSYLPSHTEEASFGAAIFSTQVVFPNISKETIKKCINYEE